MAAGNKRTKKCALLLMGDINSIPQTINEPSQNLLIGVGELTGLYRAKNITPRTASRENKTIHLIVLLESSNKQTPIASLFQLGGSENKLVIVPAKL